MTSTEFQRKINYWSSWLTAFDLYHQFPSLVIWKISVLEYHPGLFVFYSNTFQVSPDIFVKHDVDSVTIERYPQSRFDFDFRCFVTNFYNKLSYYQRQVLENDSRFTNILNFIKNEKR